MRKHKGKTLAIKDNDEDIEKALHIPEEYKMWIMYSFPYFKTV